MNSNSEAPWGGLRPVSEGKDRVITAKPKGGADLQICCWIERIVTYQHSRCKLTLRIEENGKMGNEVCMKSMHEQ